MKARHVIIGALGEVGKAIHNILPDSVGIDNKNKTGGVLTGEFEIIHICFPYSKGFEKEVYEYQMRFNPRITVIHSSVPVGTSDKLKAVYSPVRGVHPNLEKGIRTFVKYFAGIKAYEAASDFSVLGIPCCVVADTRSLEAAKLWDTTAYGVMIMLEKEIWKYCKENKLDFELVYRNFTSTYNTGYAKLGMVHVMRPWLLHAEGKIGGHCVVENAELLDSPVAKNIIDYNKKL